MSENVPKTIKEIEHPLPLPPPSRDHSNLKKSGARPVGSLYKIEKPCGGQTEIPGAVYIIPNNFIKLWQVTQLLRPCLTPPPPPQFKGPFNNYVTLKTALFRPPTPTLCNAWSQMA